MSARCLLFIAGSAALFASTVGAETVSVEVNSGISATAYYHTGDTKRPAVMILHGFMQNHKYLTLQNMTSAVQENGYALLAPTLSLGVNKRKSSLACEAVHTHTMEGDIAELVSWLKWLAKKGHKEVVLVGHSFGSITLLAYLDAVVSKQSILPVKKFIAVSLSDSEDTPGQSGKEKMYMQAKQSMAKGDNSLQAYKFSYCKKYMTPASAFVSYARWSSARILKALTRVASRVQVKVIMGGNDKRVAPNWPQKIRVTGVQVMIVEGADHFFGGEHEFDLQDRLVQALGE